MLFETNEFFFPLAPDVGIQEDIAQHYFNQLISGLVRKRPSFIPTRLTENKGLHPRSRSMSPGP